MYKSKSLFNSSSYKQALVVLGCALAVSLLATVIIKATSERNRQHKSDRLLVVTEGSDLTRESFTRFNRSIQVNELDLLVVQPNGSARSKIDSLKQVVGAYKNEQSLLILVVDGNNAIMNGGRDAIVARITDKFKPKTRVIFAADSICWPDAGLEQNYPAEPAAGAGERYLSSRSFIGYADALWDLLNVSPAGKRIPAAVANEANDYDDEAQRYFTKVYLNADLRDKIGIELDHRAEVFQNLHKSHQNKVELQIENESVKLKNLAYFTEPIVVQGNQGSQVSDRRL